jgi:nicotinate-nucleotide adenylyltransferase
MQPAKRTGQRVCLFGGTFDPIHQAHLRIAEEALTDFALDRVLFVPAAHPPHKDPAGVTPYEDRFQMVEIACRRCPQFEASRLEEGEQRNYTVDTLRRVQKQLAPGDRLFFLIGSDAFDDLESWKDWREVVKLTEFIVVSRPGGSYRIPPKARVHHLDGLALPVSSSTIRERLAAGKLTPELPGEVRQFIEARGLYGFPSKPVTVSP